ncbi:alkaline phosphatase PafA [Seonamhaeicola maritimus]|uniref:alkaline phosphatase PafA n=1 Tax=Seonamhaeicola maritimus TaxID=2591822 RepID=UPI0024943182|nr:alkaline phosphatase PafA [Seonamhaeicola maritimus]
MKKIIPLLFIVFLSLSCKAQVSTEASKIVKEEVASVNPKLVVAIVIDQMRYDYLTRFESKYGEGGFKRMIEEGFNCKNNHFNYIPTYTGPGHASIFTGTTPSNHGIIGNDWFDKTFGRSVNCVEDNTVEPIGTNSNDGRKSPKRMVVTTFTDENRLATQMRGKTIGISIKHRGAILPAGHTANAAYWFDYEHNGLGNWISSTYYMKELPNWVKDFNVSNITESYFKVWDSFYDINSYTESGSDNNDFERVFRGKETPTFPYDLNKLKDANGNFKIIADSPYGNNLTTDFTIAAIDGEGLGQDDITDILTVSYSSPDKVGHDFGVNSKEIEDIYIRLDKDLKRLFEALDDRVGKGEYTVFLTSDHGVVNTPKYLQSLKIPSGYYTTKELKAELNAFILEEFKTTGLIRNMSNNQIFLNRKKIKDLGLDLTTVQQKIVDEIISYKDIYKAYSAATMSNNSFPSGVEHLLQNGYNQKRSGDILTVPYPGHIYHRKKGTTHGSGFTYDTHVPLLFFGKGIKHGQTLQKTIIPDIAPTISALLGISFPSGASGQPLKFVLE